MVLLDLLKMTAGFLVVFCLSVFVWLFSEIGFNCHLFCFCMVYFLVAVDIFLLGLFGFCCRWLVEFF